jgi:hypothetical protein
MDSMEQAESPRVALLYHGNHETRRGATPDEVRGQLLHCDGLLVWVNPVEGERDRSVLDSMLRDVAHAGVFVRTHPDVILKLGTKEVLFRTREVGWGCDTHMYLSLDEMHCELPLRLAAGKARVLKQNRGNGGHDAPQPGPRWYHPPTKPEFQVLKRKLEQEWVPAIQQLLNIETESLPVLWDCDFLLGPKGVRDEDTYVLCEINVSSVAPYPDSVVPSVVEATLARMLAARRNRGLAP